METSDAIYIVRTDPSRKDEFPAEFLSLVADHVKPLGIKVKVPNPRWIAGYAAMLSCTGRNVVVDVGMSSLFEPVVASSFIGHIVCVEFKRTWPSRLWSSLPVTSLKEVTDIIAKIFNLDSRISSPMWTNEEGHATAYAELKRRLLATDKQ